MFLNIHHVAQPTRYHEKLCQVAIQNDVQLFFSSEPLLAALLKEKKKKGEEKELTRLQFNDFNGSQLLSGDISGLQDNKESTC